MIKLIDILKEISVSGKEPIGQGSQHVVYPYSKDPNKVIKTFDPSEGESINIEQIDTFQQYPNIFPIVYKVTDKYAVLEKLNTEKAINELEKLQTEFFNLKWRSEKKRKYSILLDDLMENDNLEGLDFIGLLYHLFLNTPSSSLKKELNTLYSLTQNPNLLKKWIDFLLQIVSIFGKKDLDIHAEQFGYTSEGQIKLLDI
jgi:hypothetical protein